MQTISISKTCKKCGKSSTYIKKRLGKSGEHYVCKECGFKLCRRDDVMKHAFPEEEKPLGNTSRQHIQRRKRKR